MRFSKLSTEAARDMLADAGNPAYHDMQPIEPSPKKTPDENFALLCTWLAVLSRLVDWKVSRDIPRTHVNLL